MPPTRRHLNAPPPSNSPIEQRIEHFARRRTRSLVNAVAAGVPLPDTIAAAYILGLRDAGDATTAHETVLETTPESPESSSETPVSGEI
jgi:hypothetical protein